MIVKSLSQFASFQLVIRSLEYRNFVRNSRVFAAKNHDLNNEKILKRVPDGINHNQVPNSIIMDDNSMSPTAWNNIGVNKKPWKKAILGKEEKM